MYFKHLQKTYPLLIDYLKEKNYSNFYIKKVIAEIKYILKRAPDKDWNDYMDIYAAYKIKSNSSAYLRCKRNILGVIESFDLDQKFPGQVRRNRFIDKSCYKQLDANLKRVVDIYCREAQVQNKRKSTIYTQSQNASSFLLSLQREGIYSLDCITEEAVLNAFKRDGVLYRGYSYKKNISIVFKTCSPIIGPDICDKISTFLPSLDNRRKNIQYLTESEISALKATLNNPTSPLSLRDRSIGILALYTGLRGCDIASLKLENIDWESDFIKISQTKTNKLLRLPLSAIVGNTLYDYILNERPSTTVNEIFVSKGKFPNGLKATSIYNIANKIMKAAGIRNQKSDRKGMHLFRHYMATTLLTNGVSTPIISEIMGHASSESIYPYLRSNFKQLKECALDIKLFKINKEVFK